MADRLTGRYVRESDYAALLERHRSTIINLLIPLEALHLSVKWELCDEVKNGIADAVKIGRAALAEEEVDDGR